MAAEPAESRRNVKLLCSFGGRILPRPSDGALRYAGGHTRILSVPRGLPFPDLMSRLADARGGVGPTLVKYQLPSEGLDALISVSCPEDLDNMMEEYAKLAGADGAARLRVFLFTPADLASADSISSVDSEQRYFDAVNGIVDGGGSCAGSLGRKDSGVSSNSDFEATSWDAFLSPDQVQFFNLLNLPSKPAPPPPSEENLYGGVNYRPAPPPLSQLPPLHHQQPPQQNVGLRFEDGHTCQKALPHAHSDPMTAQDLVNGSSAASRPLYSQWSEGAGRFGAHNLVDNVVESKAESPLPPATGQFPRVPVSSRHENDGPSAQNADHARVFPPPMGLGPDAQSSYGMFFGNFPPQQHREGAGGRMEGLRLNPTGQGRAAGTPDTAPSPVESYYGYIPQVGGSVMVPGRGYVRHIDQSPPLGNSDLSRMHNLQPAESRLPLTMAGNHHGQSPHHMEPPIPSENLLGMPTYAGSTHPAACGERSIHTTPLGDLRVEPSQIYSHDTISHLASPQGSDLSNGTLVDPFQEPASSDSLFFYGDEQVKQDFQNVAEGVASAVLNTSSHPGPVLLTQDGRKIAEDNAEPQRAVSSVHQKLEDNKPMESEKINPSFQMTDDMGRLQMIHNSDLEELRELGSGTFGTVYHGKWRGTDVAIKRINERCFAGKATEKERMRADFWNEACNLADLHHPNVVAFYGVVLDGPGGSVATVTEYMVNGSLRNALQRTIDRRKRLVIAMDVAFGMEYLHKKNIVHFDLKSDNLLVNLRDPQRPICKVGDLGLSKVKCQTLISGGVRGTLPWMAPELLNGSSNLVSEKVDIFSFGIVMWELLTGEEPYADLHYGAIIGGIVSNTLRPPVPESSEPQWRSLMEKCWSADPSERPSFTQIADSLRSIAASLPRRQVQGQSHK
ncbi:serine/threonine-protein kinase B-raf-like [Iris pallida]|uniref:Serine/threonine-protein kinase B-raf-like n=1 Tax=Iris pallida TaxID=29817 RepID=A0AAX6DSK9_IRIPA|nr:serine/threonine-protein kinase B-raf-like [Iris pallida]